MCCLEFSKRIVPFAITFILGLFVASIFYSFTSANRSNVHRFENRTNESYHSKKKCMYDREMNTENEFEEDIIFLVPPPPPPPEPLIAPEFEDDSVRHFELNDEIETTVFPPTPPETLILREELRKKANK